MTDYGDRVNDEHRKRMDKIKPIDRLLGNLRHTTELDRVPDEAKEAAEKCREILLKFKRQKVPSGKEQEYCRRFIEHFDIVEDGYIDDEYVTCYLVQFAYDDELLFEAIWVDERLLSDDSGGAE